MDNEKNPEVTSKSTHDENFLTRKILSKWGFWRNIAIHFCAYSVIGHWIEIVYCAFMWLAFDIYDPESLVWDDWLYPFLVYGVGVLVCVLLLYPIQRFVIKLFRSKAIAFLACILVNSFVSLIMELTMGFMLNQPDVYGVYPLWDNSILPLNVLGQAWLVNDICFGIVATLFTWFIYPKTERQLRKLPNSVMNAIFVIVVGGFIVLCAFKFS